MRNATSYSGSLQSIDELLTHGAALAESLSEIGSSSLSALSTNIQVDDLVFRYKQGDFDVLKGVNLTIKRGTYVVMCGQSGSGKTTLLEVLMRFRLPVSGQIKWDGQDISQSSLQSFRENVGIMFQKTFIIQGTIRDNITFGCDRNKGDDDAAVELAALRAEILDVIKKLPNGLDTTIGTSDVGMSGGQLQRICLARVLFRKPSVLLLDEATSALDPVSEAAIIETLIKLRDTDGLTIVSVSHHPSTAKEADEIVVLKKGVIAERGNYDELVNLSGGIFRELAESG